MSKSFKNKLGVAVETEISIKSNIKQNSLFSNSKM